MKKKLKLYYKKQHRLGGFIDTFYRVKTPNLLALCQALTVRHQKILYIPEEKYRELTKELNISNDIKPEFDHITIFDDSKYQFSSIRSNKYELDDVKALQKQEAIDAKQNFDNKASE